LRKSISCLALAVWLAGTLIAHGQTSGRIIVAQAPVTVPPSGVLVTRSPAPVAVPPSGVLVMQPERPTVAGVPVKMVQTAWTGERAAPTIMRRHVVHRRTAGRRVRRTLAREDARTKPTTTESENISTAPGLVTTTAWPIVSGKKKE